MRYGLRFAVLAVAMLGCAMFTTACGDANTRVTSTGAAAAASHISRGALAVGGLDGIRASGNKLVNYSGRRVHLHGVDVEGTEYGCAQGWGIFDTSPSAQNAADMAAWHINFVRLGLNATCVDCVEGVPAKLCGARYMHAVSSWVDRLNRHGIYVEVMLMWDFPCSRAKGCVGVHSAASYQLAEGPTEDNAPQAWRQMAITFRNNPDVMLGIWGEDYASWPCRLHGATCGSVALPLESTVLSSAVRAGQQSTIRVARLGHTLTKGETIWLGGSSEQVRVAAQTGASSRTTEIPVSGRVSSLIGAGTSVTVPAADVGDSDKMTVSGQTVTEIYRTAGAQQAVNIMRANGFRGPIVYTCATAANVCSNPLIAHGAGAYNGGTWLRDLPHDPERQIVAAADLYGPSASYGKQVCSGAPCFRNTVAPILQAGHPFILNEFGPSSDATNCSATYTTGRGGMLPWMDAHGASGYAAWTWFTKGNNCLDLIASYQRAGANTSSPFAIGVQRYYRSHFPANTR